MKGNYDSESHLSLVGRQERLVLTGQVVLLWRVGDLDGTEPPKEKILTMEWANPKIQPLQVGLRESSGGTVLLCRRR